MEESGDHMLQANSFGRSLKESLVMGVVYCHLRKLGARVGVQQFVKNPKRNDVPSRKCVFCKNRDL